MRMLSIGGAVAVACAVGILIVALAAWGGSSGSGASEQALQRKADLWEIDRLEKNFHKATSRKDIELMMSLYAPNATFTVGPGVTAVGVEEIRDFWLEQSPAFGATNNWVSDHPAYKLQITVNGDRGTLHFECHYVDPETRKVVSVTAGDMDVARIDGKWLITNFVGGTTEL